MRILFMRRGRPRAGHSYPHVVACTLAALWVASNAAAAGENPSASMFSLSAFGTFGLVHATEERADYTASPLSPNGAGYTHAWSPDLDSRLGAQIIAHFSPQLSTMQQLISEQDYDKTYKPHVECQSRLPAGEHRLRFCVVRAQRS
jgi:hypothetical protein